MNERECLHGIRPCRLKRLTERASQGCPLDGVSRSVDHQNFAAMGDAKERRYGIVAHRLRQARLHLRPARASISLHILMNSRYAIGRLYELARNIHLQRFRNVQCIPMRHFHRRDVISDNPVDRNTHQQGYRRSQDKLDSPPAKQRHQHQEELLHRAARESKILRRVAHCRNRGNDELRSGAWLRHGDLR
jgi:hypothetical protein